MCMVVLVLMVKCMRALQNAEQVFAVRWELCVSFFVRAPALQAAQTRGERKRLHAHGCFECSQCRHTGWAVMCVGTSALLMKSLLFGYGCGVVEISSLAKTASSYVRRRCLKRGCASWTPAWRRWTPSLARRTRGRKVCRLSLFLLSLFALN